MFAQLATQVGNVKLQTPLLLASGYITETPEFFLKARPYGCSGMVTRSLKQHIPPERAQVPAPRYAAFNQDSMLNCEWGNEKPWTIWRDYGVRQVKETGCPIIISLSGRDPDSCCYLIYAFDKIGVDAYEINISCPHSGMLHGNLNVDLLHLNQLMKRVRDITKKPIWVKLSYSYLLIPMAKQAEELGADAIVCTNSIGPGMLIDTKTAKPKLGIKDGSGGVTGKAIFPIALWCVHQLSQTLSIPVVGCGGIFTADDVIQMLMAGAAAVQLYTAPALKGPAVFKRITAGLQKFLEENPNYTSIKDLVGLTIKETNNHQFSSPRPVVINERCTGCGICIQACAFNALSMVSRPEDNKRLLAVIDDNCISCNACVGVCPPKFNAIRASF
jgi:dihydroorotate dehydrogenase subfamily 1